jgi:HEPN domain-containing protein
MPKPIKKDRIPLDAQRMYLHAWQFMMASEIVSSNENKAAHWAAQEMGNPIIVLSAFSSEIMLKSLVVLEGKEFGETHRLDKLYKILSNSNQKKLCERWDARLNEEVIKTLFDAIENSTNTPIQRDLPSVLYNCADAFKLVRYIYEGHEVRFFIYEFPRMVSELILTMRPEWNSYDRTKVQAPIQAELPKESWWKSSRPIPPKGPVR